MQTTKVRPVEFCSFTENAGSAVSTNCEGFNGLIAESTCKLSQAWCYLQDANIVDSGFRYGFTSEFVINKYGRRAVDDDSDQDGERREEGDRNAGLTPIYPELCDYMKNDFEGDEHQPNMPSQRDSITLHSSRVRGKPKINHSANASKS
ncbi:hypothetical protein BELL_0277g00090 [Botrytis elliptica]|uniref:Uncharacterized protein n=1 Tax=Botrytis elliptica TaxID=278938 RepID=A0A4Z1JL84_9HELO|nr:hypothetical protein BELL_0277g00090 [Botrytis elliptica]